MPAGRRHLTKLVFLFSEDGTSRRDGHRWQRLLSSGNILRLFGFIETF